MHILLSGDYVLFDAADVLDARSSAKTSAERRRFLIAAQRPNFQAKLYEEINDELHEVADIPGLKEGSAKIVPGINSLRIYCTARTEAAGPFNLGYYDVSINGVYPLDLIGVARLRSICRNILKTLIPNASPAIDPYCK